MALNSEALADKYRSMTMDLYQHRILMTNFRGTQQEADLTTPPNCNGFGRIRHFRRATTAGWPTNPLPIDPACAALKLGHRDEIEAQVFQNAACNWRCWYCFVPFNLLSADLSHSAWLTASQLIELYLQQPDKPLVIDLSGGQPELVPEWVPWMIEELEYKNLRGTVYLWSDDNLSCDYFWRYLSPAQQELVVTYPFYGRATCLKGFDKESFEYNTNAEASMFEFQFDLLRRLVKSAMDVYVYVTLTTPDPKDIREKMKRFVDGLQEIDKNLPLRTVALEIQEFSPVRSRLRDIHKSALLHQWTAVEAWNDELTLRYSSTDRSIAISDVQLCKTTSVSFAIDEHRS
jgi:uncharacterized Fe-S cluster-containing radical SAM superfamily protein